jgi:ribosomal protein S18 acetylase RimI-like enzyme
MGYQTLLVETNIDWYDAIRLYQRCGFKEYKRDDEEIHLSLTL